MNIRFSFWDKAESFNISRNINAMPIETKLSNSKKFIMILTNQNNSKTMFDFHISTEIEDVNNEKKSLADLLLEAEDFSIIYKSGWFSSGDGSLQYMTFNIGGLKKLLDAAKYVLQNE